MDIVVELLRKVDKRITPGTVYREGTQPVETVWQTSDPDPWHVPIRIISSYASMDDIKAYAISKGAPLTDSKYWSMSRTAPDGGALLSWEGGRMRLSKSEIDSLAKDHISDYFAVNALRRWGFECDEAEWLKALNRDTVKLNMKTVSEIKRQLETSFAAMDTKELDNCLDAIEYDGPPNGKLLYASMAALAMAGKTRTTAFLCRT